LVTVVGLFCFCCIHSSTIGLGLVIVDSSQFSQLAGGHSYNWTGFMMRKFRVLFITWMRWMDFRVYATVLRCMIRYRHGSGCLVLPCPILTLKHPLLDAGWVSICLTGWLLLALHHTVQCNIPQVNCRTLGIQARHTRRPLG